MKVGKYVQTKLNFNPEEKFDNQASHNILIPNVGVPGLVCVGVPCGNGEKFNQKTNTKILS